MQDAIVFGANAVREALQSDRAANRLYIASDSRVRERDALIALAKESGVAIERVPIAKLGALTRSDAHQGVALRTSPVAYDSLDSVIANCDTTATLLLLDRIQHPRNLGMLLRTAWGAGVDAVVLVQRGGALVDDAVVRASAGAASRIRMARVANLGQALRTLKRHGFWIYGLDGAGESELFDVDWPERVALIAGNETKGLRPSSQKICDARIRIPLQNGLDSLNVAVATGVALFQITAERKK